MAEVAIDLKRGTNTHGLYKKRALLVPDNVFTFEASDGTWTEIFDQKGKYKARYGKIFADGTNQLSKLNTIFAHANVKEVVIDHDGDITLTGILECAGKKLTFANNARFIGTYTINNANIYADYRHHCFGGTPTLTNCRARTSKASVMWFGAIGDGTGDQSVPIQRAMDTCIANTQLPRDLYFPKGTNYYRCTKGVLAYLWDGTNYQYFSLNLIGEKHTHFTSTTYSTRLVFTNTDGFGIGYQKARSSVIQGLSIEGAFNRSFGGLQQQFNEPFATWVTGGSSCVDSRYAPYTGISIDPVFHMPDVGGASTGVTEAMRHTSWASYYRGPGSQGGSSAINIEQCRVQGWTVGIGYATNGHTLNAEDCSADKCTVEVCKVAYAFGQAQIKDNYIRNSVHWDRVHTVIDGNSYGASSGGLHACMPYVDGINIAGGINRLCNMYTNFAGSFKNIFAESLFSIGVMRNTANFEIADSEFDLVDMAISTSSPEFHLWATNASFKNCTFKYYDDLFNKRLMLKGNNCLFENCRFDLPPLIPRTASGVHASLFNFKYCYCGNGVYFGHEIGQDVNMYMGNSDFKKYVTDQSPERPQYTGEHYLKYAAKFPFDIYQPISNGYQNVTVNHATGEATFTASVAEASYIVVGDYLRELESRTFAYIDEAATDDSPILGKVKSVNYGTGEVVVEHVPRHVNSHASYFLAICIPRTASNWVTGDYTSGSPTVSNVMIQGNVAPSALVGYRVGGARVVGADDGARTLTFNANAGFSGTGLIFGTTDTEPYFLNYVYSPLDPALNSFTKPFLQGTIWDKFTFGGAFTRTRYICTKSGYLSASTLGLGSQYQSEWAAVLYKVETADSLQGDGTVISPIKLDNDNNAPGNNKFYGTDGAGAKGWRDTPDDVVESEMSITGDGTAGTKLKLVNDEASPGNSEYYGTNGSGTKGYYALPTAVITGSGLFSSKIRVVDDADFTIAADDYTVVMKNNTTTGRTATVPAASGHTNRLLRIINTGTQTVTSSENIRTNPSTTFTAIATNTTVEVHSDGTDWWLVGIYTR